MVRKFFHEDFAKDSTETREETNPSIRIPQNSGIPENAWNRTNLMGIETQLSQTAPELYETYVALTNYAKGTGEVVIMSVEQRNKFYLQLISTLGKEKANKLLRGLKQMIDRRYAES